MYRLERERDHLIIIYDRIEEIEQDTAAENFFKWLTAIKKKKKKINNAKKNDLSTSAPGKIVSQHTYAPALDNYLFIILSYIWSPYIKLHIIN